MPDGLQEIFKNVSEHCSEAVQRATIAAANLAVAVTEYAKKISEDYETFQKQVDNLTECVENAVEKLSDLAFDMLGQLSDVYIAPKVEHYTPYKSNCKQWIFDKRIKLHKCRNNC